MYFARSLGARGYGPIGTAAELKDALDRAISDVEAGEVAVVDVHMTAHVSENFLAWAQRPGA